MRKNLSRFQLAANRRNAQNSTGPKTPNGRAVSKMNALKHGLCSQETVLRGRCIQENPREFRAFQQRLWEDLEPHGFMEEMRVEQIVTTYWRLRRVPKAESGEITLSVDNRQWKRENRDFRLITMGWDLSGDPASKMRESAFGSRFLHHQLEAVRDSVEKEGQLTEAAIQNVMYHGKPFSLTNELEKLRSKLQINSENLDEPAFRAKQKEETLAYLNRKMRFIGMDVDKCEKREHMEEEAHQAADVLPSAETLEKLRRYETSLGKQMYRAMHEFERLKRRRLGENIPAPQVLEISNGS